jgi:hypothetical protein
LGLKHAIIYGIHCNAQEIILCMFIAKLWASISYLKIQMCLKCNVQRSDILTHNYMLRTPITLFYQPNSVVNLNILKDIHNISNILKLDAMTKSLLLNTCAINQNECQSFLFQSFAYIKLVVGNKFTVRETN